MTASLVYNKGPRGYRVLRGDRVVAEVVPPLPGQKGDFWYTNLLTRHRGQCGTLDEVKVKLVVEVSAYYESYSRAEAIRAEAMAAERRVPLANLTRRSRFSECPFCEMETADLPGHLREIHGVGRKQKSGRAAAAPPGTLIPCSLCTSHVAPRNMARHMAKVHPRRGNVAPVAQRSATAVKPTAPSAPKQPASQKLALCTWCGVTIKAARAATHAAKCPRRPSAQHGKTGAAIAKGAAAPASKRRPSSVLICAECQRSVRKSEYPQHRAGHDRDRRAQASRTAAGTRKQTRSSATRGDSVAFVDYPAVDPGLGPSNRRLERTLDAGRDYGRAYREQGRFGSHSSHDDYGDESGA